MSRFKCGICGSDSLDECNPVAHELMAAKTRIEELEKCCTQRGARMQLLKKFMESRTTNGIDSVWVVYCKIRSNAESWFDDDGVPK